MTAKLLFFLYYILNIDTCKHENYNLGTKKIKNQKNHKIKP